MPSAPPGRYRSRLLNFLNRQSRRLADQGWRAARHLKVAAIWGTQILLYPLYLLVQTALSIGPRISWVLKSGLPKLKTLTQSQPPENPANSDAAIVQVLERLKVTKKIVREGLSTTSASQIASLDQSLQVTQELANTEYAVIISWEKNRKKAIPTSLPPVIPQTATSQSATQANQDFVIQGIASLLPERTLVIVVVHNRILDILTPQQQQKLSSRISWEIADLMRRRRLVFPPDLNKSQRRFANLDGPPVFPPARLFWRLMAWVQTSPVAVTANLFGESALVPVSQDTNQTSDIQLHSTSTSLNDAVDQRTSHQLVPESQVGLERRDLAKPGLSGNIQRLLSPRSRESSITSAASVKSPDASRTNLFKIQALIYAAIDYFFGRVSSRRLDEADPSPSTVAGNFPEEGRNPNLGTPVFDGSAGFSGNLPQNLPSFASTAGEILPATKQVDKNVPDPWLTSKDLFGKSETRELARNPIFSLAENQDQARLPRAFQGSIPPVKGNSVQRIVKRYFGRKQSPGKLSAPANNKQSAFDTTKPQPQELVTSVPNPLSSTLVGSRSQSVTQREVVNNVITTPSSTVPEAPFESGENWIETPATPTGYVKHPLEQLLERLDSTLLWIEELVMKVWRWLKRLGSGS
ncbi:hypothetical protein [Lyngbya aestuarii]|uniref:hypothetical protein n=1 Tax=Lyngbya aestuarii TaxID=118322 RepID=UPI00403DF72B